ncbi:MAG: hypothetical protein ACLRFJ_00940 [Alphaproteobacteria bacterium]
MNNITISDIVSKYQNDRFAVDAGRIAHIQMQFAESNPKLMDKIKSFPELIDFFGSNSRAEVPVAAILRGRFVSRRIDRLVVDHKNKIIKILDYKTDVNRFDFRDRYVAQLNEYREILSQIYPKYNIKTYILWLHDWQLEQI